MKIAQIRKVDSFFDALHKLYADRHQKYRNQLQVQTVWETETSPGTAGPTEMAFDVFCQTLF